MNDVTTLPKTSVIGQTAVMSAAPKVLWVNSLAVTATPPLYTGSGHGHGAEKRHPEPGGSGGPQPDPLPAHRQHPCVGCGLQQGEVSLCQDASRARPLIRHQKQSVYPVQ